MAVLILFGDGGGIRIDERGVHPVPPFEPKVLQQFRAVNLLTSAAAAPQDQNSPAELGQLVNRVANLLVPQAEAVVGPLDGEASVVYLDDDGGFTCGNTGKPPLPIPWPPRRAVSVRELVGRGSLNSTLLDFIGAASERGLAAADILARPKELAAELGFTLDERSTGQLQMLSAERAQQLTDPVDREVVAYFQRVIEDGQYLESWATRPAEVSRRLKVELSDAAVNRVIAGGSSAHIDPGVAQNPVAIAVVVGVVIMLVDREAIPEQISIVDRSGRAKF